MKTKSFYRTCNIRQSSLSKVQRLASHGRSFDVMDWADEPATWKQVKFLKGVGHEPHHHLTKAEAEALIISLGGPLDKPAPLSHDPLNDPAIAEARRLRLAVENARQQTAGAKPEAVEKLKQDLALAVAKRQQFWVNTCADAGRMLVGSRQVQELYQKYGCRFAQPTHKDVQHILDALDPAAPDWDLDHPELFFQTLELNFPHQLRRV